MLTCNMSAMSLETLGRTLLAEATTASMENATAVAFCDAEHPTLAHRINNPGAQCDVPTAGVAHTARKHSHDSASIKSAPSACVNGKLPSLSIGGESCAADDYNWCVVPHRPWDTLLFAGIAVVIACLSQGPYSSLIVLIAGGLCKRSTQTRTTINSMAVAWPPQQHCAIWPLVARCTPSLCA